MSATADDSVLVTQAQAGDFGAFEHLVNRHESRAYSIAMNILRRRHDAEDAVQTAFLNALEGIDRFRGDASFATWITRITVNTALKALRKRRGRPDVPFHDADGANEVGPIPLPDYIAAWRGDPAAIVARNDLRRILDEAIDALPEKHRVVFVLRDMEGLSVRDTAHTLGIREGNVKVRLLRARLALREALTRVFGDEARRLARDDHGDGEVTLAEDLLRSYESH